MKNSLGFPWHGSAFSSVFFTGRVDAAVGLKAARALLISDSAYFFFGVNTNPPSNEAVLKRFYAGAPAPAPIEENEEKP
jgi:hypothetical protein